MNMIAPEAYFETCGWRMEVEDGDNKSIELKCDNGADSRLSALCKTTPPLNSFDLLLRCIADGYELHNGQDVLCRMMERQEHLMTKSFPPFPTPVVNLNNSPPLPTSHSSPSPPPPGDFFTWSLPPRPSSSPPSAGGGAPPTTTTHEPGGGQILQFDIGNSYHHHHHHHGQDYASSTLQVQNQASPDGTLSEPTSQLSEVDLDLDMEPEMDVAIDMDMDSLAQYQLDLSSCGEMYKYGFTGGGHDDLGTMGMDLGMGLGQRSGLTDGDDGGIGDGALGAVEGFGMEFGVGEYLGANGGIGELHMRPLGTSREVRVGKECAVLTRCRLGSVTATEVLRELCSKEEGACWFIGRRGVRTHGIGAVVINRLH
jgi:hypothetical protein